MNSLNKNIVDFLSKNQVATVCFTNELNQPYCINCFYAFDEEHHILIFKSSIGTTHQKLTKPTARVSGTILPNVIDTLKLKLNPLILGKGIRLFGNSNSNYKLELLETADYENGLQIMTYNIIYL